MSEAGSIFSAASINVTDNPRFFKLSAISSPINPQPKTTALLHSFSFMYSSIPYVSGMFLTENIPFSFLIPISLGLAPGERINLSYDSYDSPDASTIFTLFFAVSISVTSELFLTSIR